MGDHPRCQDIICDFGSGQHLVVGSFHPPFGSLSISRGMIQRGCLLESGVSTSLRRPFALSAAIALNIRLRGSRGSRGGGGSRGGRGSRGSRGGRGSRGSRGVGGHIGRVRRVCLVWRNVSMDLVSTKENANSRPWASWTCYAGKRGSENSHRFDLRRQRTQNPHP